MASAGAGIASAAGAFSSVPYVGWAVGIAAAYIDQRYLLPALMGDDARESRPPSLIDLPTGSNLPGAARVFAFGAQVRVPCHILYQSNKVRETQSGSSKGGTSVAVRRVTVDALIHLNDRRSDSLQQLFGNGKLLLYKDRNLILARSSNMSAEVNGGGTAIVFSMADQLDPDFADLFVVDDVVKPVGFVRVAGPTAFNGTYYQVTAVTAHTATTPSTLTAVPIDGQGMTSLEYTGGTVFSPATLFRVDDAIGGDTLTVRIPTGINTTPTFFIEHSAITLANIFEPGDRVVVRNADITAVGAPADVDVEGTVQFWANYPGVLFVVVDDPSVLGSNPFGPSPLSPVSGKEIIVDYIDPPRFTQGIFPESFDPDGNFYEGNETHGQPAILVANEGSGNTSNYRGQATQALESFYATVFGDQLPQSLEAVINVDADMTWPQAVELVMQRGDLLNTQIDVSGVDSQPFRGAFVQGALAASRQLQPLLIAGQILGQDRNGVLCMFSLDNADVVQLENGSEFSDLGTVIEGEAVEDDKVQVEDIPQVDLPTSIGVRFQDPDNVYSPGYQHFGLRNPDGVDHTNEQIVDLSTLVLSRKEARNLATTLMRRAWVNRRRFRITLPAAYMHLLENDLVTWTQDSGEVVTARIIQRDVGSDFRVRITALQELTGLAVSGSPVQTGAGLPPITVTPPALLLPIPIDAPGINNGEVGVPGLKLAVCAYGGLNWSGASVFESVDGNSYQLVGQLGEQCSMAQLSETLTAQDPSEEYGTTTVTLRSQTVDVQFVNEGADAIEACTQAQAEAGKNWCALYGGDRVEIAAFTTVTALGDGQYTLGGWLRGLRGTPSVAATAGTFLVMLNQSTGGIFRREYPGASQPGTVAYKVVPVGGDLSTVPVTELDPPEYWNARPLPVRSVSKTIGASPYDARFTVDAHWSRQVFPPGTQPPHPMDEPFEAYRFDIYDPTGATLLRSKTLTAQGSGSTTLRDKWVDYPASEQTTDGYTPSASETFWVDVVQIGQFGDSPSILQEL